MAMSPEEKAVSYANSNATRLYNSAKRKQMPSAFRVGYNLVKDLAKKVFEQGGTASDVREMVLSVAKEPVPEKKPDAAKVPAVWHQGKREKRGGGY